ncbi:hypothetical protein RJ641_024461 [Dillenia turbinata]|uniref:Uncharacterized protein n=1 Tax=Dillenia turbinata TaxID=194707 RepID=A0AAN8VZS4_9MAGN
MQKRKYFSEKWWWVGFLVEFVLLCVSIVNASVYEYRGECFTPQSNSFFFNGGSKAFNARRVPEKDTSPSSRLKLCSMSSKGRGKCQATKDSKGGVIDLGFVKDLKRFNSVTFVRTKAAAHSVDEMQRNTGLVEAIIVEVKDRDRIRGSFWNSDLICCTKDLSKFSGCKTEEVIIRQN